MPITRIHVDPHSVARNQREGRDDPVVVILEEGKASFRCQSVKILGPCEVIYSRRKPNDDGAHCWIETHDPVLINDEKPMVMVRKDGTADGVL